MVMKKKTSRIKARMIQVTQLFKTMDSEQMLDYGHSTKGELSRMLRRNTITEINIESHQMRLPMEMKKKTLKTKVKMIQLTQLCKTMDLELMPDYGLFTRKEHTLMLKNKDNIDIENHPMRLPMVTRKRILKTKAKMIHLILLFKTMDSVPMLDFGPSIKDLLQDTITITFNFKHKDHLMRWLTETVWRIEILKMRETMMMP